MHGYIYVHIYLYTHIYTNVGSCLQYHLEETIGADPHVLEVSTIVMHFTDTSSIYIYISYVYRYTYLYI
jgi:hypothetical protein